MVHQSEERPSLHGMDQQKILGKAVLNVGLSPAYDLLQSLTLIANPLKKGRWREWAEQVVRKLSSEGEGQSEQGLWQTICRWFQGDFSLGAMCMPLVPLLPQPASVEELLCALSELSLADFLRIVVTLSPTNPETPLDAETLLSLRTNRVQARAFTDVYLRFTGRQRTQLLQVLADPEAARAELLDLLEHYNEQIYAQVEPQVQGERLRAVEYLEEMIHGRSTLPFDWLGSTYDIQGFSPVVLAPSVFQDVGARSYIHEIRRSLFDNIDFEPLIVIVGTREVLGIAPQKRRTTISPTPSPDPAERWANVYNALADPSRLRLLHLLAERPYYQQEVATTLHMTGATISHHLTTLARSGLVRMERRAHRTYIVLQTEAFTRFLRESQRYILGTLEDKQEKEGSNVHEQYND